MNNPSYGGAFYVLCDVRSKHYFVIAVDLDLGKSCEYDIEDGYFSTNTAKTEGGFMIYNFYPPTLGPNINKTQDF